MQRKYYEETLTVTGKVARVSVRPTVAFIILGQSGPQSPLTAVIVQKNISQFGDPQRLQGQNMEISVVEDPPLFG